MDPNSPSAVMGTQEIISVLLLWGHKSKQNIARAYIGQTHNVPCSERNALNQPIQLADGAELYKWAIQGDHLNYTKIYAYLGLSSFEGQ